MHQVRPHSQFSRATLQYTLYNPLWDRYGHVNMCDIILGLILVKHQQSQGGAVVTHWPPTSEVTVQIPA